MSSVLKGKVLSMKPMWAVPSANKTQVLGNIVPRYIQLMKELKDAGKVDYLHYDFVWNEEQHLLQCRESYERAEDFLTMLQATGPLFGELMHACEFKVAEIHGPKEELDKLRGPLSAYDVPRLWFETVAEVA